MTVLLSPGFHLHVSREDLCPLFSVLAADRVCLHACNALQRAACRCKKAHIVKVAALDHSSVCIAVEGYGLALVGFTRVGVRIGDAGDGQRSAPAHGPPADGRRLMAACQRRWAM